MSKEAIDPTPRLEKALAAPEKAPAVPEKPPDKPEKAPDKPEKPPAKPEKGPDKPAPAPLTPPVINDGFIYLRLHMPGKQSLYFAETPKSDGTTTHPYALLSSDKSKRAPVQLIHTDLDATSDQELKDKDTVDLRCMKTKDKKDYDRLYGSSGGWAKYTTHDDPNQAKLTWTIERANSGGVLRDGDIVKLRDNHYTHHICGNLDKTWEEEKGYYIKVMSEDKDSKLNGSCSWIVEVVKDYQHNPLANPEEAPAKPAPAPLTPPVINDGFIYLRLHMPGKQSLYFAETPKSDGTTTHPYALLSSDKSKRAPVQLIHTDLDATSDQELKDKDTVDLRCMKTKDKKDYDRLYGSSGGWAKYTTHDDPNQAKLTWTIERANSGGVLRDGDIVKLRDNHYTHHICGNLDKTWEEEKGYYIKVMSEDKDSKLNGSCSWIVEVVKDYLHTTLYPHL